VPPVAVQKTEEMRRLISEGRFREATVAGEAALSLCRQALGDKHPEVGRALARLSTACVGAENYTRAQQHATLALAIARSGPAGNKGDLYAALVPLGIAATHLSRWTEAEAMLKEACDLSFTPPKTYAEDAAPAFLAMGALDERLQRYAEAERNLVTGLGILDRNPRVNPLQWADALETLGVFYLRTGDYERAEPYLARAYQTFQDKLPPKDLRLASILTQLGRLNRNLGEDSKAKKCFEDSLSILRTAGGAGKVVELATTLHMLAVLQCDQGQAEMACRTQAEALRLLETAAPPQPVLLSAHLNNMGWFNLARSNGNTEATAFLQRSLKMAEANSGMQSEDVGNTLATLALVASRAKNPEALALARRSDAIYTQLLETIMRMGSEDQKESFIRKIEGKMYLAIEMQAADWPADANFARFALETVLRRKGIVADAMGMGLENLRNERNPQVATQLQRLSELRSELSHMALDSTKKFDAPESRRLWTIQRDMDQLLRAQSQAGPSAGWRCNTVDTEQVRKALPASSVLIEYVLYRPANPGLSAQQRRTAPLDCAAYLLFPDGRIEGRRLGSMRTIAPKIQALRRALVRASTDEWSAAARELAVDIVHPLLAGIGDATMVFIAPDGLLHLVPFGTLPDRSGRMLVERTDLTYVNSGRDLLPRPRVNTTTQPPLILAQPDYDAYAAGGGRKPDNEIGGLGTGMLFLPLPGTGSEGEAIRGLLAGARLVTGQQAGEATLRDAHSPEILHIATHGFFLDEDGLLGEGLRGIKRKEPPAPVARAQRPTITPDFRIYQHPSVRSGLALAGANRFEGGRDDGILTALEVMDLDLRGTELVVLSACETGLGDAVSGSGVFGMRRSFMEVGARTQVLSLWKVHDEATRDLMTRFYRNILAGEGKVSAMRHAQLALRREQKDWQHPFFWAAFVVAGDWSPCRKTMTTGEKLR
ncbi:MAG: CHAT domain-containing protein, partial [Kiritimatiellia bacterium]